jgi:hypothetical protein
MAKRSKAKEQQEALLAKMPPGSKFVLVKTEKGDQKYRPVDELAETDEIQVNKDGIPVVMKGKPGRPQAIVLQPASPVVAEVIKRKQDAIHKDRILDAVKTNPENPEVLHQVVLALGEEAASLGFERAEAERDGRETSNISVRRVNTLKALADTWLKRKDQVTTQSIDMGSPAFKTLLQFLLETFQGTLTDAGVRPEMVETVFARLAKAMNEEWEAEARNRMKKS